MHIIVLASRKGGVGKTTLSAHLAVQAAIAQARIVAVMDTDPMANLSQWWNAREAANPIFVNKEDHGGLTLTVNLCRDQGVGVLFIDTPPSVTTAIEEVIEAADLVIVPVTPSPNDLRGVRHTVDLIERHHKPMVFVINDANKRARITGDTAVALSQHGMVASVQIHSRMDFRSAMIDGRTVMELDAGSNSAQEVRGLWDYITKRLNKIEEARNVSTTV